MIYYLLVLYQNTAVQTFTYIRVLKCYTADPTGMCIKCAPYLHKKSANLALNRVLLYALVLMLLTKSFQIAPLKGGFGKKKFNNAKFAQNRQI